jgi:hypothetical protein
MGTENCTVGVINSIEKNDVSVIVEKLIAAEKENAHKRIYNLDIIDELHANENAHTRILIKLFHYREDDKYLFLQSFVKMLQSKIASKIPDIVDPVIDTQLAEIDGYIEEKNSCGIIIENKIQWASDQLTQIERYISFVKNDRRIPDKNIYVVYLTDDGRKKVSDYSLTESSKLLLNYKNDQNAGRFITVNYRDDILPFLKDLNQYPSIRSQYVLHSAIVQYIDYLEGRFGQRTTDKEYNELMNRDLLKALGLNDHSLKTIKDREELFQLIRNYTRPKK